MGVFGDNYGANYDIVTSSGDIGSLKVKIIRSTLRIKI